MSLFLPPGGIGVRVDRHVYSGYTAPSSYDSLLGKILVWGEDRAEAIARMRRALAECIIIGPRDDHSLSAADPGAPAFVDAELDTGFLPRHMDDLLTAALGGPLGAPDPSSPAPRVAVPAQAGESA